MISGFSQLGLEGKAKARSFSTGFSRGAVVSGTAGAPSTSFYMDSNNQIWDVWKWTGDGAVVFSVGGVIELLIYGGGGAGGNANTSAGNGGGGGAGHFQSVFTVTPGTYLVTVGAGGTSTVLSGFCQPGGASRLGPFVSPGGNPGAGQAPGTSAFQMTNSGFGGGLGFAAEPTVGARAQGGGGGAGGVGGNATYGTGGIGGAGLTSSIDGTPTARCGGGGGGGNSAGSPGTAGGGAGSSATGGNGAANTGGGAGGGGNYAASGNGGSGGVIMRIAR